MITFLGGWPLGRPLPAKMAPHAIWTVCGAPFGGLLEPMLAPRWPKWHQAGPLGTHVSAKITQSGTKITLNWNRHLIPEVCSQNKPELVPLKGRNANPNFFIS